MMINLLWKVFQDNPPLVKLAAMLFTLWRLHYLSCSYNGNISTRETLEMVKVQNVAVGNMFWWGYKGSSYVGDISLIQRETGAVILKDKKLPTEWNLGLNKRDIFAPEERDLKRDIQFSVLVNFSGSHFSMYAILITNIPFNVSLSGLRKPFRYNVMCFNT